MIQIVADDKIPFLKGALEGVAKIEYMPGGRISRGDLLDADALITRTRTKCDRSLLKGTKVGYIASATIGYDHIDTGYCAENGVEWTNAPGCNSSSVQQYIVSTLLYLALRRNIDLKNRTIGVVGVGNVGSKVALAAEALGMHVLKNDPPRERLEGSANFVSLEELILQADFITMHVPLNRGGKDNTFHMVNDEFIRQVRKGAKLINTSRGGVVNEYALMEGIRKGVFSDVVLDVFENEPKINPELLNAITLATPHIAGYSLDGKANGTTMSVQAISRHFNLGLNTWKANSIPAPVENMILADAAQDSLVDVLWEVYRHTYDISLDDRRLRSAPEIFEQLRGNYPPRREPFAYSVRLFKGYPELTDLLEKLDFSVLADHCA